MPDIPLYDLLIRYFNNAISEAEEEQLVKLVGDPANEEAIQNAMQKVWETFVEKPVFDDQRSQKIFRDILKIKPMPVHRVIQRRMYRIAVAASITLLLWAGYWFFIHEKSNVKHENPVAITHDVAAPNVTRATLRLSDGTILYLDSAKKGSLAIQGNVNVEKTEDGKIVYSQESIAADQEIKYNTINNPRGSKAQPLTLIDGTQVWLNAESSITYPTAFVGNERKVSIIGEAYFEVTKDATKKFIVDANGVTTEVLGTHFNVNCYADEKNSKVTLLEGSVKVSELNAGNKKSEVTIKPGEQVIAETGQLTINKTVDLEEVMAWKNGKFIFGDKADIQSIMRQIARWYDVEVEYKGNVKGFIGGSISRDVNVSNVLSMLEKTGEVKFKIEGKKISVLP